MKVFSLNYMVATFGW